MASPLRFRHGVHPPEHKELTEHLQTRRMPFPPEVVLHMRQHAGKPAIPIVKAGDRVERGSAPALVQARRQQSVHRVIAGGNSIEHRPDLGALLLVPGQVEPSRGPTFVGLRR